MHTRQKFLSAVFFIFTSLSFAQLPGYSWYKIITIQSGQVQGPGSQTDFPVLISHTDPDLRTATQGGEVKVANAWDIKFTAADGITPLDHQIEKYDSTTGQIVAWVKVPSVSSATNTDIRIYYGNSAIAADPSVSTVWDANFVSAYHLDADEKDATASGFNLTNNGSTNAGGIAASGQGFSSSQFLSRGVTNNLLINGDLTIEAFVNLNSLQGSVGDNFIIASGEIGEASAANYLYALSIDPTGILRMFWESGTGTDEIVLSTAPCSVTAGTWSQITVVRDASNKLVYFYENGNQIGAAVSYTNNANGGSTNTFQVGSDQNTAANDLDGMLDEVRISNVQRSPEWIKTNYNSIASPSTFYTMGTAVNTCTAPPSAAVAGVDQDLCGATMTTLAATNPAVGSGLWDIVSGFGTLTNANLSNTTVTGLGYGPLYLVWKTYNQTCPSNYDTVIITNYIPPSTAFAGTDFSVCAATGNLAATTPTAGLGTWTVLSGGASVSIVNNPASPVTGITNPTNVFVWTISSGVCTSSSDTVVVSLDTVPTTAAAGSDQLTCNDTLTLAGNSPLVGTGTWSVLSGAGVVSNANSPTSTVTSAVAGNNTFIWTIANGSCPSSMDTVVIAVDTMPTTAAVGANQNICASSALITSNSPTVGTGVWSLASGTGNITFPNSTSTTVSSIGVGTSVFVWSISNGTCPASTDTLVIVRSPFPSVALAGNDQITCTSPVTLAANVPTIGTGSWGVVSGSGTFGNVNTANTTVSGFTSGLNVFVWTIASGSCPSSTDTVIIDFPVTQTQPNAGPDQLICASTTTMAAVAPTIGTGTWSVIVGTANIVSPNSATSLVSNLVIGSNSFVWNTSYNGSCPGMSDTVVVLVDAAPTLSYAGVDDTICGTTGTLSGSSPSVGNGTWTLVSGTGTFTNANAAVTNVTGLTTGQNTFAWTITNGVCPASTDTVIITSATTASVANAGADTTVCSTTATLNAATPTNGSGTWTAITAGTAATSPASPTTGVTGLSVGTNVFLWTVSNGVCPGSTQDSVRVFVDANPTTANAGADIDASQNAVVLNGNTPTIGTGIWSLTSGNGNILTPPNPGSTFLVQENGDYYLTWTITNGVCPASTDVVIVRVKFIDFPQIITPNNDGANDAFAIPSLNGAGKLSIRIFNRWGSEVYYAEDYTHNFNGTTLDGKELAEDTYMYILQVNHEEKYQGYFAIKRK